MLLLPIFNAKLNPCPVNPAEFAPHPQGNFCGQCQRVVHDFSHSTDPRADLAAARAAAPDGRVCGRFGAAQVQAAPRLSRRLRWFVAALVLVVAQDLTAREALAQVRRATPHRPVTTQKKHKPASKKARVPKPSSVKEQAYVLNGDIEMLPEIIKPEESNKPKVYTYAEVMPKLQGKNYNEIAAFIQQQVRWPKGTGLVDAEGRVFVSFTVDTTGQVRDARILKGIHPLLDAEALRVVQAQTGFTSGRQNGKPVDVSLTIPITFRRY